MSTFEALQLLFLFGTMLSSFASIFIIALNKKND